MGGGNRGGGGAVGLLTGPDSSSALEIEETEGVGGGGGGESKKDPSPYACRRQPRKTGHGEMPSRLITPSPLSLNPADPRKKSAPYPVPL